MQPKNSIGKEQAIALHDSEFWKDMTYRQRAEFQLNTVEMCMPFGVFLEAVREALGRPVFDFELVKNYDGLIAELHGVGGPPTLQQVIEMIPAEKRIVMFMKPVDPRRN